MFRDTNIGGMGSVRCSKGIIYVDLPMPGEFSCKLRIIVSFSRVKA
jgi:hypothetical protein